MLSRSRNNFREHLRVSNSISARPSREKNVNTGEYGKVKNQTTHFCRSLSIFNSFVRQWQYTPIKISVKNFKPNPIIFSGYYDWYFMPPFNYCNFLQREALQGFASRLSGLSFLMAGFGLFIRVLQPIHIFYNSKDKSLRRILYQKLAVFRMKSPYGERVIRRNFPSVPVVC